MDKKDFFDKWWNAGGSLTWHKDDMSEPDLIRWAFYAGFEARIKISEDSKLDLCDCGRPSGHPDFEDCHKFTIPMILKCPECHTRHIDKGEFVTKPHRTHACQNCGHCWRPSIYATVGVQFLPGLKDKEESCACGTVHASMKEASNCPFYYNPFK